MRIVRLFFQSRASSLNLVGEESSYDSVLIFDNLSSPAVVQDDLMIDALSSLSDSINKRKLLKINI